MNPTATVVMQHSDSLQSKIKNSTCTSKERPVPLQRLISWPRLSEWRKADEPLKSGYRKTTPSVRECVKSLSQVQRCRTTLQPADWTKVNIFSHLFGAILFLASAVIFYNEVNRRYKTWSMLDLSPCLIFMSGVSICFILSAAFHTCSSHSIEGYNFARQLDFQGIIILVVATSAPQVYFTFYSDPISQRNYWLMICSLGILASIFTFVPAFNKPDKNVVRVLVFAALGLSTFIPIIHGTIANGWENQSYRFPLWAVALTHTFNIVGAMVYILHFPEYWWQRRFDIFGASHQLMHMAIVGAALSLLGGTVIAFDHADANVAAA